MLRERCANARSGKLVTHKRQLRHLRLLHVVVFFSQRIPVMRASVARSNKNVRNQQFCSVKTVFAFLFFRLWQAVMSCRETDKRSYAKRV